MKYLKTYEIVWGEITDFAKSLKVGDLIKWKDGEDLFITEVIRKTDTSICIVNFLYFNDYTNKWQFANDKSFQHPNYDLVSYCASPITKEDMKEMGHFIVAKKYNL